MKKEEIHREIEASHNEKFTGSQKAFDKVKQIREQVAPQKLFTYDLSDTEILLESHGFQTASFS